MEENDLFSNHRLVYRDGQMSSPPKYPNEEETEFVDDKIKSPDPDYQAREEGILLNARALNRFDTTYKLETFEKNYLMIFNHVNIMGYNPRLGTEKDVEALEATFSQFGFEIHVHSDLTKSEILEELKVFNTKDFTDYGCVVVAVLTHGADDGLLRAKDQQYSETEIMNCFKTHDKPTLITKPKILIIQACRGRKLTPGVFAKQIAYRRGMVEKDMVEDHGPYTLPVESDMLVFHSSYMGNPSHRAVQHGSWFIQVLCREINRLSPIQDIESIIIEVKRAVAIDMEHEEYNKRIGDMAIYKQMPVITSTLIRKLYFKAYSGDPPIETLLDSCTMVAPQETEVADISAPETPLLTQLGPCLCFLPHYKYLKECLRLFVEANPDDTIGESYLGICETFEDLPEFNSAKEKMVRVISQHLENRVPDSEDLKYIYLYKNS